MSVGAIFAPPLQILAQPSEGDSTTGANEAQTMAIPQPLATPTGPQDISAPPDAAVSSQRSTRAVSTITGQGTVGNIAKFVGPTVIGNSVLFENAGKIGIGLTNPAGLLSIKGTASNVYPLYILNASPGNAILGNSNGGIGVYGTHSDASGDAAGVQGDTNSASLNAAGVRGTVKSNAPGTNSAGVRGVNNGTGANGYGVYGSQSGIGTGVYGTSPGGSGVYGTSNTGTAVLGDSAGGTGVRGRHTSTTGTFPGVIGTTNSTDANAIGVQGVVNPTNSGNASAGVSGINNGNGDMVTGYGVYGSHAGTGIGVYGTSAGGIGVEGVGDNGYGIVGSAKSGYAGFFVGDVYVGGKLTKASGSFKIDHPLHPATEYLSHSFVESPDMMNVYNGNIITNGKGEAWVTLPSYFRALNRDFRYQLTPIGQFAQAIVGQEITGNRFLIRTDKPSVKVSWQVTGIRQDAYARQHRIHVEETKTGADRGKYLYPAGFGAGPNQQIGPRAPRLAAR